MSAPAPRTFENLWPPALLTLLAAPLMLYRLGSYSLVNGDEAIYHAVATTMVESGDWFRLDFRGEHRIWDTVMNAPIQYWARALLISAFGDGLWTARILSSLCGLASVLMTYRLVLLLCGRLPALLAGLLQLTTFQFVYLHSARTGELETALTLLLTSTAYLFLRAIESGRSFVPHHVCLVLILNLKLPTIAIPLLAELACFALLPAVRPQLRRWLLPAAWILPLGLTWHVVQMALLWDSFWAVVATMGVKAAGEGGLATRLASNASYYASSLLFGAFPHVLAYPFAILGLLASRDRGRDWRWWVMALFLVALFAFYLPVAERNRWYVIPAYPFFTAFLACWIVDIAKRHSSGSLLAGLGTIAALVAWTNVELWSFNPFAEQANRIAMDARWNALLGISPIFGMLTTAALLSAAAFLLARSGRVPALPRALSGGLAALLLLLGGIRVAAPLQFLEHQSEMARIRSEIDAATAAGEAVRLPIGVAEPMGGRARFYFAEEFELVPVRSRSRLPQPIYFQLHPRAGDH